MKFSSRLRPELEAIREREEMKGERVVNRVRIGFCLLSLGMLVGVYGINTPEANAAYTVQVAVWLAYAAGLLVFLRRTEGRYFGWLKYVSITVDIGLLSLSAVGSALNHAGILEYYQSFIPLTFVFWNMMSGFRLSLAACVWSTFLTALLNALVLAWTVATEAVAVSPISVFGEPAINLEDQSVAIVFIALPGLVAGLIARTSRNLVLRAEEATLARQKMEKERDRLGRYMSKELVELVLRDPDRLELGGKRREVTIMFTDLRNFTAYAEGHDPERVVALLNAYFREMTSIVFRYGGTLDKFMGDGLMAVFGAPFPVEHAPLRAALCALEMHARVRRWNEERVDDYFPEVTIGVGIATGLVVAGNVGSFDRMEYTCIGDAVNLASRLEGLNRDVGSSILLCEETGGRLADVLPMKQTPPLRIKGKRGEARPFVLAPSRLEGGALEGLRERILTPPAADPGSSASPAP